MQDVNLSTGKSLCELLHEAMIRLLGAPEQMAYEAANYFYRQFAPRTANGVEEIEEFPDLHTVHDEALLSGLEELMKRSDYDHQKQLGNMPMLVEVALAIGIYDEKFENVA